MHSSPRHAFTLIELLIVVAIIAILAAIAVPNFLEAQTRSKITRAKSDMRTVATALESYAVDHNHYPPHYIVGMGSSRAAGALGPDSFRTLPRLTTPIAYITSIDALRDPFVNNQLVTNAADIPGAGGVYEQKSLGYQNYELTSKDENNTRYPDYRAWGLSSIGVDAIHNAITWRMYNVAIGARNLDHLAIGMYDATNGTVSEGDIARFGGAVPAVAGSLVSSGV